LTGCGNNVTNLSRFITVRKDKGLAAKLTQCLIW
jgi:hypothetical protein